MGIFRRKKILGQVECLPAGQYDHNTSWLVERVGELERKLDRLYVATGYSPYEVQPSKLPEEK